MARRKAANDEPEVDMPVDEVVEETPAPEPVKPEHDSVADAIKAGVRISHQGTHITSAPQYVKDFYPIYLAKVAELEARLDALEGK